MHLLLFEKYSVECLPMLTTQYQVVQEIERQIVSLVSNDNFHFDSKTYQGLRDVISDWKSVISNTHQDGAYNVLVPFSQQSLIWPSLTYGKLDSLCFFSDLELGVWITYIATGNHSSFWDVGSHHGIDALIMAILQPTASVLGFEPDVDSFNTFKSIVLLNSLSSRVHPNNCGLSWKDGTETFVKVHGNTTASHIQGARTYHDQVSFCTVRMDNYTKYSYPDFAKINIEGYEKELVPMFSAAFLENVKLCIEIHSKQDMEAVFESCKRNNLFLYTQSSGFRICDSLNGLPHSNRDGYVYITSQKMNCALSVDELARRVPKRV